MSIWLEKDKQRGMRRQMDMIGKWRCGHGHYQQEETKMKAITVENGKEGRLLSY